MGEPRFTSGPWDVIEGRTLLHVETAHNHATPGIAICSLPKNRPADADLIASVTELYGTLKAISEAYEDQNINHVDFRVWAKRVADAALSLANPSPTDRGGM